MWERGYFFFLPLTTSLSSWYAMHNKAIGKITTNIATTQRANIFSKKKELRGVGFEPKTFYSLGMNALLIVGQLHSSGVQIHCNPKKHKAKEKH